MTAASASQTLPSLREIAVSLPNGRVSGDKVRFQDPRDPPKRNRRDCTFWFTSNQRDGWTVSSAARNGVGDLELKDAVRKLVPALGPFQARGTFNGHGKANGHSKAHRPAGGPDVGRAAPNGAGAQGEGGHSAARPLLSSYDAYEAYEASTSAGGARSNTSGTWKTVGCRGIT